MSVDCKNSSNESDASVKGLAEAIPKLNLSSEDQKHELI